MRTLDRILVRLTFVIALTLAAFNFAEFKGFTDCQEVSLIVKNDAGKELLKDILGNKNFDSLSIEEQYKIVEGVLPGFGQLSGSDKAEVIEEMREKLLTPDAGK